MDEYRVVRRGKVESKVCLRQMNPETMNNRMVKNKVALDLRCSRS